MRILVSWGRHDALLVWQGSRTFWGVFVIVIFLLLFFTRGAYIYYSRSIRGKKA